MKGNRTDSRSAEAKAWHRWYKTARWQRRRARQLQAHPLCRWCLESGRIDAATVADHITAHKGDPEAFWHGELSSLCKHCHDARKQSIERRGYDTATGLDGWPIDPNHPANRR